MDASERDRRNTPQDGLDRRHFLGNMLLGAASASLLSGAAGAAETARPDRPADGQEKRKIKLGILGCGGRGNWISQMFRSHGGFEIYAVADYFDAAAQAMGEKLGVAKERRFSGLSGYKKMYQCGIEAVDIVDVPYFYPEQARAAIEAGLHVYTAKPVAVDVPGTLSIGESGKLATQKRLCFLVDYQLPTDPAMIEIAKRVGGGALGTLAHISSIGFGWQGWPDPALGTTIESRLTKQIWLSDTALSGDTIVSYDIHIIDGILSVIGQRPVAACGRARTCRTEPHGDRTDVAAVIYEREDGLLWTHVTQAISNNFDVTTLTGSLLGMEATAHVAYSDKVFIRGGKQHYAGTIDNVFNKGVERNIASFHRNITEGHFENPTVQRAVDGHLTAILGREAAARRRYLTMEELLRENKRLTVSLEGLKA